MRMPDLALIALPVAVFTSLAFTLLLRSVRSSRGQGDSTSRLGGLSLICGLVVTLGIVSAIGQFSGTKMISPSSSTLTSGYFGPTAVEQTVIWLIMFLPMFVIGVIEDLKGNLSVRLRFWLAVMVGVVFSGFGADRILNLDLPFLDPLDRYGLPGQSLGFSLTVVAIAGYTHAMNIVDGLHGLASGSATLMLIGLGSIAMAVGAVDLAGIAFMIGALSLGFFLVNFPRGLVFLGDCGAYFLGFFVAALAIALPARYPTVSPWASLVICSYPIIEVLFSIFRRWRGRRRSPGQADQLHLHSLLFRRVVRNNPRTTALILAPVACLVALAVSLADKPRYLQFCFVLSVLAYVWIYRRAIRSFIP